MRNLDFSSWQSVLATLMGLVLVTLLGVGIRLLVMTTIQQRRERMNRQINERLRTLIAAYKVLGGSFTGNECIAHESVSSAGGVNGSSHRSNVAMLNGRTCSTCLVERQRDPGQARGDESGETLQRRWPWPHHDRFDAFLPVLRDFLEGVAS